MVEVEGGVALLLQAVATLGINRRVSQTNISAVSHRLSSSITDVGGPSLSVFTFLGWCRISLLIVQNPSTLMQLFFCFLVLPSTCAPSGRFDKRKKQTRGYFYRFVPSHFILFHKHSLFPLENSVHSHTIASSAACHSACWPKAAFVVFLWMTWRQTNQSSVSIGAEEGACHLYYTSGVLWEHHCTFWLYK